jgi:hypothetical protein
MRRVLVYLAVVAIGCVLGANVYNSVVDAPSWGANIPQSLETAQRYFDTGNPGKFFRVASPLAQCVLVDALTFAYFYPRNAIMFEPPIDAARASVAWREWSAMTHVRSVMALVALVCELMVLSRLERLQSAR